MPCIIIRMDLSALSYCLQTKIIWNGNEYIANIIIGEPMCVSVYVRKMIGLCPCWHFYLSLNMFILNEREREISPYYYALVVRNIFTSTKKLIRYRTDFVRILRWMACMQCRNIYTEFGRALVSSCRWTIEQLIRLTPSNIFSEIYKSYIIRMLFNFLFSNGLSEMHYIELQWSVKVLFKMHFVHSIYSQSSSCHWQSSYIQNFTKFLLFCDWWKSSLLCSA